MNYWLTPFEHPFMQTAFALSVLVGVVCATLSCFLVLKGWALMGDAVSHAVFPGIVIAYIVGAPLALGAFGAGLACAIGTGFIKENSRLREDTVMGVVFTGMFAFGLVLFRKVESDQHLDHILFGNLLGLPTAQVCETVLIGAVTLLLTLARRKDLLLFCFDAAHARSIGLNTALLHYMLLTLLALTIVTSLQAVGIILVVAMLITPGCVGFLLSDRFGTMLLVATGTAVFSCLGGVYVSFLADVRTAACIVLFQSSLFVLALIFAPKRGLLSGWRNRRRHRRISQEKNPPPCTTPPLHQPK
jgi:ABC-type Mn2+/Zn2+ transport system permease subunit